MSLPPETPPAGEKQNTAARGNSDAQATASFHALADSFLAPLRVRNFRLLFSGQMISTLGDMFYAVALPWLMLSNGHSPQELGIVLAAYGVSRVGALLVGGVLSDKWRPRRVMLLADTARALLTGALVALVVTRNTAVWQLCAVTVPLGAFAGLFLPAYYAMLPEILSDDELQAGNALNSASIQLALSVGSGAAGLIISRLQSSFALAIDALTFVVSAATLLLMSGQRRTTAAPVAGKTGPDSTDATTERQFPADITFWQLLRTWRLLQVALLVIIFGNFLFNGMMEVALPTLARSQFAAGASGYGLLLACFGGGSLLGGLIAGTLGHLRQRGMLMLTLIMALAVWYSFVPFSGGLIAAALLIGSAGFTNGILTVLAFTLMQQQAPRHLLGRLMAILMVATLGLYPFSVAIAGVLTSRLGPAILFPISGAMMLAAALFGWLQPEVRKV
ncbi:MAG TPA: MFS transporter [Ktedonobacteraceae bacterium]|nr:MFS transporter [Ktedonobacteraceae bacterium]